MPALGGASSGANDKLLYPVIYGLRFCGEEIEDEDNSDINRLKHTMYVICVLSCYSIVISSIYKALTKERHHYIGDPFPPFKTRMVASYCARLCTLSTLNISVSVSAQLL